MVIPSGGLLGGRWTKPQVFSRGICADSFVSFQSGKWGRPLHDENSAIGFGPYFGRKGALHPDPNAHF